MMPGMVHAKNGEKAPAMQVKDATVDIMKGMKEDGKAPVGAGGDIRPWECCPCRGICAEGFGVSTPAR
jgi:hypothetical protein